MNPKSCLKKLICVAGLSLSALTAQADLLDDIQARGEIVIATEARYEPFEMLQDGKIVGYGKDILDAILADLPGSQTETAGSALPGDSGGTECQALRLCCHLADDYAEADGQLRLHQPDR